MKVISAPERTSVLRWKGRKLVVVWRRERDGFVIWAAPLGPGAGCALNTNAGPSGAGAMLCGGNTLSLSDCSMAKHGTCTSTNAGPSGAGAMLCGGNPPVLSNHSMGQHETCKSIQETMQINHPCKSGVGFVYFVLVYHDWSDATPEHCRYASQKID